jgi:RND family efflux transporter MFP subunit
MTMKNSRTLLLLAVVWLATGCGGGHETAAPDYGEPVAAETAVATIETVPESVQATGTVEPWARVSPGTKILGRIDKVLVREGDRVRAGAVLAVLEKRDLEAAVEQARAAVAMAEANHENAAAQHRRMEMLHERGSVTDKNLEDALAHFRVTAAAQEQANANLAAADVALGYAEICSPVAGWVVAKRAEAGDMAAPGQPVFIVEDLSRVKVTVTVPESDVIGIERGQAARVGVDVLGQTWDAQVDRVIPAGDRMSRTYDVHVVLPNPDGRLKSGMFARAEFPRGERSAMLVPATAVIERGQLQGVHVVDAEDVARLRWVRPGRAIGERVEILSGLDAGERYVVDPPAGFSDGTVVESR